MERERQLSNWICLHINGGLNPVQQHGPINYITAIKCYCDDISVIGGALKDGNEGVGERGFKMQMQYS